MKKLIIILILFFLVGCNTNSSNNTYSISEFPNKTVRRYFFAPHIANNNLYVNNTESTSYVIKFKNKLINSNYDNIYQYNYSNYVNDITYTIIVSNSLNEIVVKMISIDDLSKITITVNDFTLNNVHVFTRDFNGEETLDSGYEDLDSLISNFDLLFEDMYQFYNLMDIDLKSYLNL